ncbi:hypothetical protein NX059_010139 [Plenodomus lindquistii]|nr:hypothetical protein NX059_010139 [Plenodomus lindquistii]
MSDTGLSETPMTSTYAPVTALAFFELQCAMSEVLERISTHQDQRAHCLQVMKPLECLRLQTAAEELEQRSRIFVHMLSTKTNAPPEYYTELKSMEQRRALAVHRIPKLRREEAIAQDELDKAEEKAYRLGQEINEQHHQWKNRLEREKLIRQTNNNQMKEDLDDQLAYLERRVELLKPQGKALESDTKAME